MSNSRPEEKGEEGEDAFLFQEYDPNNTVLSNPYEMSDDESAASAEVVDEKDIVVLDGSNISEYILKNNYVMVLFYTSWSMHCKSLMPEYAKAATELKDGVETVLVAKVDATYEFELNWKYKVVGYPSIYFFFGGVYKRFRDDRNKDAIVAWAKNNMRLLLNNLTTTEEAEKILASGKPVVLGFLNALVGSESNELSAASLLEDDVEFYQTTSSDVAKLFHIDPEVKKPALVLVKKYSKKINHFGGKFTASKLSDFVSEKKHTLIINLSRTLSAQWFYFPIKKQLILFSSREDYEKFLPVFEEAVEAFNMNRPPWKIQVLASYVDLDDEEFGKNYSYEFGVREDAPTVVAYENPGGFPRKEENPKNFLMDGEITVHNIKSFGEKFLQLDLKPFNQSDDRMF